MAAMREKLIRDPVHDVIAFRIDLPTDGLLFRLLNATEFQRLRRIRQLGMASLAYPGADHSRYSHSLGVMQTARGILEHLAKSIALSDEQTTVCLVAALLHDLGHGPFSHVFEHVSGINHEKLTNRIILDPQSDVHQIMERHEKGLAGRVAAFLRCDPSRTFLNDVICSQLDADRFDYLLRDNLMTGSRYGDYDLKWLVHALTVDPASNRLAVTLKGVSAAEDYLQARYHMYRNVYFHKVVRSSEGMVRLALQRAKRLAVQDRLEWPPREHGVTKALLGQRLTMGEFNDLDDISVLHCFKQWMTVEDPVLAGLCRGLLFRRIFKTIDLSQVAEATRLADMIIAAEEVVTRGNGDPAYDLFFDEPADTAYERLGDLTNPGGAILILDAAGKLRDFSEISPVPAALNRQLQFQRLHVHPAWKHKVAEAIGHI